MAVDMFLKLTNVEGEAQDSVHAKEIDILAWSWGANQSGTMHIGGGGGSGKVSVHDLSITKWVDRASSVLWNYVCTGEQFAEAVLTVRKAGGKTPVEYIVITFKEVIVTSVSTGGSGGEDRLTENVTLNFAEFKISYTQQKQDGTGDAAVEFGWDIARNATAS